MKKLFNGRFLFILASSLIVLILLVVGAFFLFNDEDDKFVRSGYVLNPLSSTAEKYFFDENVGYKENLSSMIEFVDVDEKTVSILKDSFIHYNDESLSFMKKGAILDLDSVKGDSPVAFYNITSESIIERNGDSYTIDSANGVALITGDPDGAHMEFDNNEIMAKSNGTTAATLYLQSGDGDVEIGSGGTTTIGGKATFTNDSAGFKFAGRIDVGCLLLTNTSWTGYGTGDPSTSLDDHVKGRVYFRIIN